MEKLNQSCPRPGKNKKKNRRTVFWTDLTAEMYNIKQTDQQIEKGNDIGSINADTIGIDFSVIYIYIAIDWVGDINPSTRQ